jgi:hypothetical protein
MKSSVMGRLVNILILFYKEELIMGINVNKREVVVTEKPKLNRYERAMKMMCEDSKVTNDKFIIIKYKENETWYESKIWFRTNQDWKIASLSYKISKNHNEDVYLEDILKHASNYDKEFINSLKDKENICIDEDTIFKVHGLD